MHTLTRSKKIWYIRFHALLISNIYYIITQTYTNWNAQMESKRCSKALENVVARFKPSQNNKTWWRWEHILKCKITSLQFITDIMKIHLYRALMEKGEKRKKRSITHSNRCRIYRQTCLKKKKKKRLVVVSRIKSDVPIFKKKKGKKQKLVQNKKILSLTHTHTHTQTPTTTTKMNWYTSGQVSICTLCPFIHTISFQSSSHILPYTAHQDSFYTSSATAEGTQFLHPHDPITGLPIISSRQKCVGAFDLA